MIPRHRITDDQFTALASGLGGPSVIRELWRAQRSRRLLLVRYLAARWPKPGHERDAALAALGEAERRSPATVRDLLAEPMVGAWAATTVRHLEGIGSDDVPIEVRLGRFGAVAAVAALRAGTDADLHSYVWEGGLSLPGLGLARLACPDGTRVALTVRSGQLRIDGTSLDDLDADWEPLRTLRASASPPIEVAFEDLDPYRDEYHVPAAPRISGEQFAQWQRRFAEAWDLITGLAPVRGRELAAGLLSVVPLSKRPDGPARSATAGDTVGVLGLDLPQTAAHFAVALVHEFQHSKLTALIDIVPLYDMSSEATFFAPWRADPRPVSGLFQGVYAFIGVADMWRTLSADPRLFPEAPLRFAEARIQVSDAIDTLAGSGLLRAAGQRFVAHLRAAARELNRVELHRAIVNSANELLEQLRARWHLRVDSRG